MDTIASRYILSTRVDATSYEDTTQRVRTWAKSGESRYVCVTSVHGVIEARDNPRLRRVWNDSDLNTPDGMPLVWALKAFGVSEATRVYGPTLTLNVCRAAAKSGLPIGLYGGTPESLDDFSAFLEREFPGTEIACKISPPFRPLTDEEDERYTRRIAESGARILLVGIGCPKQERWMYAHQNRIPAVMIGVGAAFDFHAGRVPQAPRWVRQRGFEWLFRLAMEPRRLWGRYSRIVPRFIWAFSKQLARHYLNGSQTSPHTRRRRGLHRR